MPDRRRKKPAVREVKLLYFAIIKRYKYVHRLTVDRDYMWKPDIVSSIKK